VLARANYQCNELKVRRLCFLLNEPYMTKCDYGGLVLLLLLAGVRDYMVVGGYEQVAVEAVCIGIWKFKGNPAPLQMVHITAGDLRGRTFAADPPKGKVG
jgi:hypothetical protein